MVDERDPGGDGPGDHASEAAEVDEGGVSKHGSRI
jgi:hypothetical protein